MKISVAVTSYNLAKEGILPAILEAWCRQTIQPDEYVIADAMSEDNTIDIVNQYKDRIPVRIEVQSSREGWCPYTTKYALDHTSGDVIIIDHAERLWRDDYIEVMTRDLQRGEWRTPACGFIYDGYKHADPFPYNDGDNCIDNILSAPFDQQWEKAKELSHAYVQPTTNIYWETYGGYTRPAWCAVFYRGQWEQRIGVLPTDSESQFSNDEWYQRKIWTTEEAVHTIKQLMVIHLYHTRIEHNYWRHPTKTWRDNPDATSCRGRCFEDFHKRVV